MILAIGFNNRKQQTLTAQKEAQRLHKMAKIKFPNATILFPIINFSEELPNKEKDVLRGINDFLRKKFRTITPLREGDFKTEKDNVQWTAATAKRFPGLNRETWTPSEPAYSGRG